LVVLIAMAFVTGLAAADDPGQGLPNLIRANERFGLNLLEKIHSREPQRNVVVSPISVTLILACLRTGQYFGLEGRDELGDTFGWGSPSQLAMSAKMLLAAFEEAKTPKDRDQRWITNTILYRSQGWPIAPGTRVRPFDQRFADIATRFFGVKFVDTAAARPTSGNLRAARTLVGPLPKVPGKNDAWISSGSHLRAMWRGNTFSMSKMFMGDFETPGGQKKPVVMITSEMELYLHAKTNDFEAVALPCDGAYMIAVLPAPGRSMQELERELAASPEMVGTALQQEVGKITMPTFHLRGEQQFRAPLEEMGIRRIFWDLSPIVTIPASYLTNISQAVDLQVDKNGIRADAETIAGAVYGGIMMSNTPPFHMKLDRPFLFLIRDVDANALLFVGAVMDPSADR
jgi:serpin B